jgi:hypothetical protein
MRIFSAVLLALALLAAPIAPSMDGRASRAAPADADREIPAINRTILAGARRWLALRSRYDAAYHPMPYPGGDVPADRGACVDLVIRALRHAGYDLQKLIHEDRLARPGTYPGRAGPDRSLDHRRCVNQVVFLRRHARSLTVRTDPPHLDQWLPGDLVYYGRARAWHAGIVSDRVSSSGMPYIIDSHQDAGGVSERHLLTRWGAILAHFRLAGPAADGRPDKERTRGR